MKQRFGAFQLSISLIVVIVFAIIVLSLAVVWIQGLMSQITYITNDLTQQAQAKIQQTFQETDQNFHIWPEQYTLSRGETLKLSAGVRNNAEDGRDHTFVINVEASEPDTEDWVEFDRNPIKILINSVGYIPITITVPSDAVSKTYAFFVSVCTIDTIGNRPGVSSSYDCTVETLNWGGSAKGLRITVK